MVNCTLGICSDAECVLNTIYMVKYNKFERIKEWKVMSIFTSQFQTFNTITFLSFCMRAYEWFSI